MGEASGTHEHVRDEPGEELGSVRLAGTWARGVWSQGAGSSLGSNLGNRVSVGDK